MAIIKRRFQSPAFSQICRIFIQLHPHKNICTIFLQNISICVQNISSLFAKYFHFLRNISSLFAKYFQIICKNCFARELGLLINMVGFWASSIFAAIYCNQVGKWIWQLNAILKVSSNFKTNSLIFIFSNKNDRSYKRNFLENSKLKPNSITYLTF